MSRHRTTARSILAAGTGTSAKGPPPAHIIFPVVGDVQYTDDFGQQRSGGPHQGNDIIAPKKSAAVAAEGGRVKYWTTSASAGCMLYLYGQSGTTYLYIHLNNDLTAHDDNRGKCVQGVAYAVKDGARVGAGQQLGYVGDSGDAAGAHAHLHFEVHPRGGKATDPYPLLQAAQKLLFASKPGAPFALTLSGTVVSTGPSQLVMNVATSQAWPSALTLTKLNRTIALNVPAAVRVQAIAPDGSVRALASVTLAQRGQAVVVWTQPAPASLKAQRGDDGALAAALVQLGA